MIKVNEMKELKEVDPEVYSAIQKEIKRLNESIELIASENVVSTQVMQAVGSVMTNKYAEGYPDKRYYGGCINVDVVENLAKKRVLELFGCEKYGYDCNVQPHSGSQANMAVYMAFLSPNDKVMGMDLGAGGHLTHGCRVNFSGKLYEFFSYGVDNNGYIDYDKLEMQAMEIKPKMIVAGASAYPREIDFRRLGEIAKKVGAYLFVDMAHIAGLVATGLHQSPFPHADFVTSTTHKTLRGPRGGIIICRDEFIKKINSAIFPGIQGGPLMHVISGKAVSFLEAMNPNFKEYQRQVVKNAKAIANTLLSRNVDLVSGGTDNHLLLLDLRKLNLTGREAENLLEQVGITTNKNGIPNDPQPPTITSGVRIGSPAITTRGFLEEDCIVLANAIADVLNKKIPLNEVSETVKGLCAKYPLFNST